MRKPKKSENGTAEQAKTQRPKPAETPAAAEQHKKAAQPNNNLSLAALSAGMPGLTPACGQTLAEAAAVCLESRSHETGVRLERAGLTSNHLD